jgi:hypothetical protein
MSNEISLKVYKIDWKRIVDNATDKRYWNHKWTVFEYSGLFVEVELEKIDILNQEVSFKISCQYRGKKVSTNYNYIPFSLEKRFVDEKMNSFVFETMAVLERRFIEETDLYQEARELESNQDERLREIAIEYLDDNGISLSDVREAYIDVYVSNNSKNYTNRVFESLKYKILTKQLLTFCQVVNKEEKYNVVIEKNEYSQEKINEIRKKITESLKEIETEEYIDEMKSNLEGI